jgi:uncharacterized iron-regulated membrane protein
VKRLRSLFFWAHLLAGATAGIVILIMSATGAALALKPQILKAIDRGVRTVDANGRTRVPVSHVLATARTSLPDATVVSIAVERDPSATMALNAGTRTLYADPYTGSVLGDASPGPVAFFRSLENWHRWLGRSAEERAAGRAITGASNLVFLGLALTGLYLWWPRAWSAQHTRAILAFRRTSTARARDFNWHNVIGFWCLVPIVIMTASGVVMSYPWANTLLYRMTGSEPPAPGGGARGGDGRGPGNAAAPAPALEGELFDRIDRAWLKAEVTVPAWSAITLRVPARAGAPIVFTITDGGSWNPFARSQLTLDGATLAVRQWQPYVGQSLGQRARGWARFGHTGELGGTIGQIVAGIGCIGGVMLVWTGLSLAVRRLLAWVSRRRRGAAIVVGVPASTIGSLVSGGESEGRSPSGR